MKVVVVEITRWDNLVGRRSALTTHDFRVSCQGSQADHGGSIRLSGYQTNDQDYSV